jgi:hypothetical protein
MKCLFSRRFEYEDDEENEDTVNVQILSSNDRRLQMLRVDSKEPLNDSEFVGYLYLMIEELAPGLTSSPSSSTKH